MVGTKLYSHFDEAKPFEVPANAQKAVGPLCTLDRGELEERCLALQAEYFSSAPPIPSL
jgi:hypothetical protein